MSKTIAMRLALVTALLGMLLSACSDDDGGDSPTPTLAADPITSSYGAIVNTGGTPVITSDYVLESMTCADGVFTMVTAAGTFSGDMDCAAMPPDLAIAAFGNKPITILISPSRLKIEAIGAGTLDMPVVGADRQE
jgi:hypothetical protein